MADFRLTRNAERDLLEIWRYSCNTWSEQQANRYLDELEACCREIGVGNVRAKHMSDVDPRLRYCHRNRHFIFWLEQPGRPHTVIALLHEQMNLVKHLNKRLEDEP